MSPGFGTIGQKPCSRRECDPPPETKDNGAGVRYVTRGRRTPPSCDTGQEDRTFEVGKARTPCGMRLCALARFPRQNPREETHSLKQSGRCDDCIHTGFDGTWTLLARHSLDSPSGLPGKNFSHPGDLRALLAKNNRGSAPCSGRGAVERPSRTWSPPCGHSLLTDGVALSPR